MEDRELKRNASGYYDEPCYRAVTAPPKPGEIWTHVKTGFQMLVVANVGGVYATMRLTEQAKTESVPVVCRTKMYVTPIMMGYSFESDLCDFVKSIKDEEFKAVKRAIADVLGLGGEALEEHGTLDTRDAEADEMADTIVKLKAEAEAREKVIDMLRESLEKVSREADRAEIYREMYTTLLDKVISARGNVNE